MALGTVTPVSPGGSYSQGNLKVRIADVQCTAGANYTTGGETITAASVGLSAILAASSQGIARTSTGATALPVAFDYSPSGNASVKLQVYRYDGASAGKASLEEAASNFDASTFVVRVKFTGL